jgi:hypothetical protein
MITYTSLGSNLGRRGYRAETLKNKLIRIISYIYIYIEPISLSEEHALLVEDQPVSAICVVIIIQNKHILSRENAEF